MPRTVKDPEERREEFLDTAEGLFKERGYYATSVDDIVDRMGVAKGLFYYYFKTKDELVEAVVDRLWEDAIRDYERIMAMDDLTAVQKLFLYSNVRGQVKAEQIYLMDLYVNEPDSLLVQRMMEKGVEVLRPILGAIIEQGVSEGSFDTGYPYEAAEFLIRGAQALLNIDTGDQDSVMRGFLMTLDIWERVLGAERGSFMVLFEDNKDLMVAFARQSAYFKGMQGTNDVNGDG